MPLQIKRIYETPENSDGFRILVDRLWPRGVSKARAQLDEWLKDITPSTQLRVWFGHKPENMEEFATLYRAELDVNPQAQKDIQKVIVQSEKGMVTLLYAAKDPKINHAIILKNYIEEKTHS